MAKENQFSAGEIENPSINLLLSEGGIESLVESGRLPILAIKEVGADLKWIFGIPPIGLNPKEHTFKTYDLDPTVHVFERRDNSEGAGVSYSLHTTPDQGRQLMERIKAIMEKIDKEEVNPNYSFD